MNDRKPQRDELNLDAPAKLQEALKELYSHRQPVPPEVDAAVLRAARQQLQPAGSEAAPAKRRRHPSTPAPTLWEELRTGLSFWLGTRRWAVASTVIVAGALVWLAVHSRGPGLVEDLNQDGVVDMLDAFALARQLEHGQAPRPRYDLNGDGVVDAQDVQLLAAHAVMLEAGGHS